MLAKSARQAVQAKSHDVPKGVKLIVKKSHASKMKHS